MDLIFAYKLIGLLSFFSLMISIFLKKQSNISQFFKMLFKVFLIGYYFLTFFVRGNLVALTINYVCLLIVIVLFIFETFMKKYHTKKSKAIIGLTFLIFIFILLITGFFI